MTKLLFSLLMILYSFLVSQSQERFKIRGELGGTLSGDLVLAASGAEGFIKLDQALMVDGNFEFTGRVDQMMPAYVLTEEQQPIATLMLENLEYTIVAGENGIEVEGGGESQNILNQYNAINQIITREKMKVEQEGRVAYAQQNQMKLQALQQHFNGVQEEMGKKQAALFQTYRDSPVTAFVIASAMGQMDYTALKAVYEGLGETAKKNLYGQAIARQIDVFQQMEPGSVAPDFKGSTAEGETISLYGINSKLKLIDFWASWCVPCRQEMSNVCRAYKKYHEAGLEILGVSLDDKKENWLKAMKEDKMTWPNISDLKGGQSEIAARYLVRGIPHTVLLDGNNRIIAKNLRGKELEKKIAELLKD